VTRFMWFGRLLADSGDPAFAGFGGVPIGAFQVSLVLRAAVLVLCLWAWIRTPAARLLPSPRTVDAESTGQSAPSW